VVHSPHYGTFGPENGLRLQGVMLDAARARDTGGIEAEGNGA
jgi:hypothetical protein